MRYINGWTAIIEYVDGNNPRKYYPEKEMQQALESWKKQNPKLVYNSLVYLDNVISTFENDLKKFKALQELDMPHIAFKTEIGSEIYGDGDYDDTIGSLESLISYVENVIVQLKRMSEYCKK